MISGKRHLTCRTGASFEMRGTRHLLDVRNSALEEALPKGCRALVVAETDRARSRELNAWFGERQKTGRIESFHVHEVRAPVNGDALAGALEIIQAGTDYGLRRHDAFVSAGGPATTDMTGFAAAIYRRSTRCVRLHSDWPGLLHSVRRGPVAQIGTGTIGATGQDVWALADYSQVEEQRATDLQRAGGCKIGVTQSYTVEFTTGVFDPANTMLSSLMTDARRVMAFVDDYPGHPAGQVRRYIDQLRARGMIAAGQVELLRLPCEAKNMNAVMKVVASCRSAGIGPEDMILAIGGGTLMDVVGFAATLHGGGCRYIRVPTTLVGMIDAGVGLKVGVNFGYRKNFLGAYFPPLACICDPQFLETLPAAEIRCGLAEAIKIAAVRNAGLFERIERSFETLISSPQSETARQIMAASVSEMLEELEANPFERELRRLPDFGHEFAHILEGLTGFRIRHGEAVSIGMALSVHLAWRAGVLARDEMERILELLLRAGLPITHPCCEPRILWQKVLDSVLPHKAGNLHLAVPDRIGHGTYLDDIGEISPEAIDDACRAMNTFGYATAAAG